MTFETTSPGKNLWLRWALANAIGLAVGLAIWGIVQDTLGEHGSGGSMPASLVGLLSVGAVAGTLEWFVLRAHLDLSRWNVVAGSVGYAAGMIAGFALGGPPLDFILGFLFFVLATGIVQWLALRRQVPRAGWWVPASIVALLVGGVIGVAIISTIGDALDAALGSGVLAFAVILALLGAMTGTIGGAISGVVMLRMLRQTSGPEQIASLPSEQAVQAVQD